MPHLFNPLATLVLPSQAQQHQQQQPPQMFAHNGGILQQPQAGIFNFAKADSIPPRPLPILCVSKVFDNEK